MDISLDTQVIHSREILEWTVLELVVEHLLLALSLGL